MSVIDKLMKVDPVKVGMMQERKYKSKRLAYLMGAKEPVEITVRELKPERLSDLLTTGVRNGEVDTSEAFRVNAMICTDAIVDPSMKDKDLQQHFGCATPLELVEKLFKFEVIEIADMVVDMAGIGTDSEGEVKN